MLETTRIRREGYSSRLLFADFVRRYKVLGFPCAARVNETASSCRQILEKAGVDGFEVGKTKVFMRYSHADELNGKLKPFTVAATMLSRYCRGFTGRSKYSAHVTAKRKQAADVAAFCELLERKCDSKIMEFKALVEEDEKRPKEGPGSLSQVV